MLRVTGTLTIKFEFDGEETEKEIKGSEFSLEEDGWRHLGDGDH